MFYQNELQFLCDTLRRNRVSASLCAVNDLADAVRAVGIDGLFGDAPCALPAVLYHPKPQTVYRYTDPYGLCFFLVLLPETAKPTFLLIGPYLAAPPSRARLLELGQSLGVSGKQQAYFEEYYMSVSVMGEGNPLYIMVTTFCERIWKTISFAIIDVNGEKPSSVSPINAPMHGEKPDDILINIKTIDKRCAFENELLQAVTHGQLHKEAQLIAAFREEAFEKRLSDPLRNAKNYCVIMNTLLRKAAENGGVHPLYLDRISSEFAAKIEHMPDLSENASLMREMFRSYCRLVRKHAMQHFFLVVQKTILLIESDLSANLTLHSLADRQNVSPGYLSTIFKKDTGKTVLEYIREKRIQHAAFLLATTHQQIQTVALHCGIMDVQYFSKTFKKLTGKTPKEYRESARQPQKV